VKSAGIKIINTRRASFHLNLASLADAVGRLDEVFGESCHQDVTSPKALTTGLALSASN
jgi:hypothetical protein